MRTIGASSTAVSPPVSQFTKEKRSALMGLWPSPTRFAAPSSRSTLTHQSRNWGPNAAHGRIVTGMVVTAGIALLWLRSALQPREHDRVSVQ